MDEAVRDGSTGAGAASSVELLRRARAGDRDALDRLVQLYLPRLRRWATGRLPRALRAHVDTDDMIQDTLIGAVRRLDAFEPRSDGAFQAYLRQALRHRIVDEVRRARRRPGFRELDATEQDLAPSPLEEAIGAEAVAAYELALGRLDAAEREAVIARVELGVGYAELARVLHKPTPDAARMAVSRALVRLAREMGHGRR